MKKIYTTLALAIIAVATFAQPCSKLFFSEYVEGYDNNKALEIYNPTINTIDLNGYSVIQYNNGSSSALYKINLKGTIAPSQTYVICNSLAATFIKDASDSLTTNPVLQFNGNDVVALLNGTDTLDRIGQIGLATNIIFGADTGKDHTFVRNASVQEGTTDWSIGNLQWNVFPRDTVRLGAHTMTPCAAPTDTLANFSPTSYSFTGVNGAYSLNLVLNSNHDDAYSVDVEIKSGDALNVNGYATQTINFAAGVNQMNLPLTITNDTVGGGVNVIVFRLTNETGGILVGDDSLFTLTLNAPVVLPNGIASLSFNQFGNIYPNPNQGQFTIQLKTPAAADLKLLDLAGRTVYATKEIASDKINVNVSDLPEGIYIVELHTGDALLHTKVNIRK
ncbi:MAG: lamin tail domain-containing protein [Bacteroidetes bacterium]|nr:lamin tail domain-containing protein [Bacteroidota bacterium]